MVYVVFDRKCAVVHGKNKQLLLQVHIMKSNVQQALTLVKHSEQGAKAMSTKIR